MPSEPDGGDRAGRTHARTERFMAVRIQRMSDEQAESVAHLHIDGISGGFLSSLGPALLADLYRAVNRSPIAFVFVAVNQRSEVVGYVSGTEAVRRLYRHILLRRGWRYVWMLAQHAFSWIKIKGMLTSVLHPTRMDAEYPDAELLSIVVRRECRGTGAAGQLLAALLAEFRERRISLVRLIVMADLARPNAFYLKHGFRKAGQIDSHDRASNVLVIDTSQASEEPTERQDSH